MLFWKAATRVMNPTVPTHIIDDAMEADPEWQAYRRIALDEDALFYARSRGIPEAEARALLTEAFVGEVIDRIGHEGARAAARAWAAERLGA